MCSIPGLPSPGSNVSVLITRVNLNPLCVLVEFWGNFDQDRRLAYQQMKKEIQYPREVFHEAEGKPGDLCLVRVYETWYRARIVSRNDTDYSVFLIDEGKTLHASTSILAWGQTDFFYLPPEVEFCVLSNVLPLSPENRWSKMALEFMKTFCGRAVTACVQDVVVPQRTFLLDIPCLSRQMYEMGFAKKLSNERFKDFVSRSLQSDSGSEEPLRTASIRYEPLEQIEKRQCYMYPELQDETVETVVVTEVTNPLRVFCQLKVFSQELKKLTEQITRHYEGRVGAHFARPENLGAPCASRGSDGKWYRSVLQQVMSSSNVVEVLHVDYGKKQFVQVEHVKPLASEFFRMPVVTYVCSLHGVIDRGVGWTVSQIDYLKSLLLNRTVIAKFEYQSLSEGVHYVTLYGDENTNINNLFGFREKCIIDSRSHGDYALHKSGTSQRCHILAKGESQGTEDLKGNTRVFFTESLPPNTFHVAVVQHVDSPSKFWIQTRRYAAEFDQLMNGLAELYSDPTRANGLIRKPVAGLLCVAKSQDDVFYRAAVCEVSETKAKVFFLDYGNTELVDCFNLHELPLRYQNLPALAVKCALYGVQPRSDHWDLKATSTFAKAVHDKVLDVSILAKSQDTHFVQVIDSLSDGEKDLSKLLCSAGFAEGEAVKKAVDKPVVKPYTKVVQTSDLLKTNAVSQSSSSLAVTAAFKEYLFPIGSTLDVTVSYIESPNDFWCQKANNAECLKLLMQELQHYYANSEFQPPLEAACVARHPENGIWYRAMVIQKQQASNVNVLFVDYGETKRVAICDLRRINPAFLKLKGQAFRCCLYNLIHPVSHSTLEWSPDAMLQFQEFVEKAASMNVVLKCTVYAVMYDSQKVVFNVVDLETPFQSICRRLVHGGLAECAPSKKVPLPPLRLDTYYYSSHGIKTGSEEAVRITCVKNVSHFFCHLQRNSVQVDELGDKVGNLCSQLESINCPKTFGKVCFAKYTDGLWYRGQINSTKPSVVVHFVDYGDTQEVMKSDLLPVPIEAGEIMSIPVQAVECGLSDMPEKVPSGVNNWFESCVTDRQLKALIVAKEPAGKLIVELYDGKTQVNAIIREKFHLEVEKNEQITVKGFNVKDQYRSYSVSERRKGSQWTPEHWRSQKSAGSEPESRKSEAESQRKSLDGDMKRDKTQIKLNRHCSHRESHSESENPKLRILKQAELPVKVVKQGLEAEVFISHCNSPLSFFVQLVTDEGDICSLVEKLNDQPKHAPVNPGDLSEGDLVSAVFPDDNCWYRAVVRKAPVIDTVDVEFIDFGNTAEVSISKLCILDRLVSQPRYSIHCSLTGPLNVDSDVASNFKKEIEKNADGIICTFIHQSGSVWEVKLEANGQQLGSAFSRHATVTEAPRSPVTDIHLCTCYKNPDISTGQVIAVYASLISGPQLFWCQYAETEQLQEISDVIQKFGNDSEIRALNEESPPIGNGCIALFDEDQLWYRAKVTSREQDTLSVLFVDYGNESKVKMSDVRPLPSEVSDLPPQAFACQLDSFDISAGSWDDRAADQFFELINDQLLKVTVSKLGSLYDLETPHFVRLECDKLVINDAMKNCWRTLLERAHAPAVASFDSTTVTEPIERPKESLRPATEYLHSNTCVSPLKMQQTEEECDCTMAEHEELAGSLVLLDKSNVAMGKVTSSQDEDPGLKNVRELVVDEHLLDSTDVISKEAFTGSQYTQPNLPQDSEKTEFSQYFDGDDLILTYTDENQVENASPEGQPSKEFCDKVCDFVSEHEENRIETDHEIIKSDLGHLRAAERNTLTVGLACVLWSHAHKSWCRARILKISDDSTLVLLLDHNSVMVADPVNIFEIVPEELLQVPCGGVETDMPKEEVKETSGRSAAFNHPVSKAEETGHEAVTCFASQDPSDNSEEMVKEPGAGMDQEQPQNKGHDSCLGDLVEAEQPLQEDASRGSDLDLDVSCEMSGIFVADVSVEQSEPVVEMDPKIDLAQNFYNPPKDTDWVQTEDTEETCPPVEEQEDNGCKTCEQAEELMDFIPAIPLEKAPDVEPEDEPHLDGFGVITLEKAEETWNEAVACITTQDPFSRNEETVEEPQDPLQEDASRRSNLGVDAPWEMSEMFDADVSVAQSEPVVEMDPRIDLAQNVCSALKVQVHMEDTEETSLAVEEQGDHGSKTCVQAEELMDFIPAIPLEKAQNLEPDPELVLDALIEEVNSFTDLDLASDEQGSNTTSDDTLKDDMVETELLAAGTVSSGSRVKPSVCEHPDPEEPRISRVTHLTLKIADTSDDDIIFVKEWHVSPTDANEPRSEE